MDSKDQLKLITAGFTILRPTHFTNANGEVLMLKAKGPGGHEWHTYEKDFKSKASWERRIKELQQDPKIIIE